MDGEIVRKRWSEGGMEIDETMLPSGAQGVTLYLPQSKIIYMY